MTSDKEGQEGRGSDGISHGMERNKAATVVVWTTHYFKASATM
jgi:hypothetical protein